MAAYYGQGTVVPVSGFDAEKAAEGLRKAMKGLGTDEKAIIEILVKHCNEQRREIEKMYKTMYGRDLRHDLKSELSGHFEDVIIALLQPPRVYDAKEIKSAIKGAGTDETTLIEILCSRSNEDIKEIKEHYKTLFKSNIEKDISSDTSGHFKRLLVSRLAGHRDEGSKVDSDQAQKEAQELHSAGEGKMGTDESTFNRILCTRNFAQLQATFDAYKALSNHDIEHAIKSETSGYLEDGYLAVVRMAKHVPSFFAEQLHKSMKGGGTKDEHLVRLVVSRSEIDMVQIKEAFQRNYGKTLASFIKGDCSGDYKRVLLAVIGE